MGDSRGTTPRGTVELALFAGAIAGRPVPLEFTRRTLGYSDGSTIYLPVTIDPASVDAQRLVICLAALQRSDAYRRDVLRTLRRSGANVSRRYLLLEVRRSCAQVERLLPRSFNAALIQATAGLGVSGSATESLCRARSTEALPTAPVWFGDVVASMILSTRREAVGSDSTTEGDTPATLLVRDYEAEQATGDRSRIMERLSAPMRNSFGEALQKLLGMGRSAGEGTAGAQVPTVGERSARDDSVTGRPIPGAGQQRIQMAGELVTGAAYPEWDIHRGRYREKLTLVGEFDPAPTEGMECVASPGNRNLMRALAHLGLSWRAYRGEPMGDNLDLSALVDLYTSVAAGHGGEARVYTASRPTSQRLGVLILLDATGSTAETSGSEMVFAAQRTLAFELTSALDQLGVRTATYGFYSRGRRNVRFLHAKSFDEPWSSAARRRLVSIGPSGFTRLGAAIRHATALVATRAGTDHQLVVLIGDGVVYDHGYRDRYATADVRSAIEEAAGRGVATVGLSVCPVADHSVWPADTHRVVCDADELAPHVRDLFGRALRSVSSGTYCTT